jgi:hypothetical protein
MIDHETVKNILPGLDIIEEVPGYAFQNVLSTRDYVKPIIRRLSALELENSTSTLIYGILYDIITDESHPGIYLHLWNHSMTFLSSLRLIGHCDGIEDFLPETAFQRYAAKGQLILEQWFGLSRELCSTSSFPNKNFHQLSLDDCITELRDHTLHYLLSLQYLSNVDEEILLFLCEEILANSHHDAYQDGQSQF